MKVILIDPFDRVIKEIEIDGSLDSMYKAMQCDCFDLVRIDKNDGIFVDDEGLLKLPSEQAFFKWDDYDSPLAGRALVIGCTPDGDSTDANHTVPEIAQKISWLHYIGNQ